MCAWCRQPVRDLGRTDAPVYCSRLHQDWARAVAAGGYPVADCPRCGRHDLRIAAPDWAICQTCGYQTDRPDLPAGVLTTAEIMNHSMSDIKERLADSQSESPEATMIDFAQTVVDGLMRAGYPVIRGTEGHWLTTTAICHGGDNTTACWFRDDGKGGLVAGCFSGNPNCDTRVAAPALRAAAGIPESNGAALRAEWHEQCVYRHPEGYTSRRAMRYDWPGGSPVPS